MDYTCQEIAKMIDHSLLRPDLTDQDIVEGCETARKYQVAGVCCRPSDVTRAKELLHDSGVMVEAVVGFPHGSHKTRIKVIEAEEAIQDGAEELDMVIHIGKLRSRDFCYVRDDIKAVAEVAHRNRVCLKVILENCYLDDELKEIGCQLAEEAGADFVKTSTGFAPGGATLEDLQLMRRTVSPRIQLKAAGGVRDLDMALKIREIGVTRFGATRTAEIIEDCKQRTTGKGCCS